MVVLVAGERQPIALDRVGDEAVRAVVLRTVKGLEHGLQVVAAEIGHQLVESRIVVAVEDGADGGMAAEVALQMRPPRGPALEAEGAVEVVRAGVDPVAQHFAARALERRLQELAVLHRDDTPADRGEELLDLGEQTLGHHPVEALPVVVDHPPDIADIVLPALEQGLEDVALVELRIADDGHHPPLGQVGGGQPVQPHIILGQRGEEGHGGTQADRARGEVDPAFVLGAGGIGLGPAQGAEVHHLLDRLAAQQVHGGVVDRARMRLHRHPVARPQHVEVEGGHHGRDRGAGGLMPAHLQLVAAGADMVGVMDGPAREPQQLPLDRTQEPQPVRLHRRVRPCQDLRLAHSRLPSPGFSATQRGAK